MNKKKRFLVKILLRNEKTLNIMCYLTLIVLNGISIVVFYLMPNPLYAYFKYRFCK